MQSLGHSTGMEELISDIKKMIEDSEPNVTVVEIIQEETAEVVEQEDECKSLSSRMDTN